MSFLVKPFTIIFSTLAILSGVAGFFVSDIMGIEMNPIRNVAHILIGIFGINASGSYVKSRWFLILAGFAFGVLSVLGFWDSSILHYYPVSQNDNVLHAIVALVLLAMAFSSKKKA
jgi:hypothetical protein